MCLWSYGCTWEVGNLIAFRLLSELAEFIPNSIDRQLCMYHIYLVGRKAFFVICSSSTGLFIYITSFFARLKNVVGLGSDVFDLGLGFQLEF